MNEKSNATHKCDTCAMINQVKYIYYLELDIMMNDKKSLNAFQVREPLNLTFCSAQTSMLDMLRHLNGSNGVNCGLFIFDFYM